MVLPKPNELPYSEPDLKLVSFHKDETMQNLADRVAHYCTA
jgi:hypothetical protein